MNEVKDKVWFLREGLFAKYVVALVGLVVFVLAVNGALETWISYRGIKTTLRDAMSEKAEATAKRIEQSMSDLDRQISWVTRASSTTTEQRRADYAQLLNQVPAVTSCPRSTARAAKRCGCRGRPSRSAATRISPATSASPRRSTRGASFAAPYFREERPFMSLSLAHSGYNAGVTVAEIDLSFLNDFLGDAQVGKATYAYVVDAQGRGAGELLEGPRDRQEPRNAAAGRGRDGA